LQIQFLIQSLGHSLKRYLKSEAYLSNEVKLWRGRSEIKLNDFSIGYESYCTAEILDEDLLNSERSLAVFKEFGLSVETRNSGTTLAYVRVKFAKPVANDESVPVRLYFYPDI
jgi:hypothetical protein